LATSYYPTYGYDYYEPRVEGHKFRTPRVFWIQWWGSSDYRKTIALDHSFSIWVADMFNQNGYYYSISPRVRFSDRVLTIYSWAYQLEHNNIGYYDYDGTNIFFGSRKLVTITNTLNVQFAFTAKSFLNIRARHYVRNYSYNQFFILNSDGTLSETNLVSSPNNMNYNLLNIDMFYQWHFAPGSELVFAWKNQVEDILDNPISRYFDNIEDIFKVHSTTAYRLNFILHRLPDAA